MDKRPFEKMGWGVLLTVVLAALGVTPADTGEDGKNYPGSMWVRWAGGTPSYSFSSIGNRIANELVPVDVAPVLDWHAMSVGHAAVQDPVNGIRRRGEPYGSDEFSDATVVVRWSQLAQDNAFAVDPAMTDPFPNARGWTMMYLAMHDAFNAIVPKIPAVRVLRHRHVRPSDRRRGAGCPRRHESHLSDSSGGE